MRYGLISDVHGNLAALTTAIDVLRRAQIDRFLCLGDLVGYGPFPNECVARVRALEALCVAGNHDLIATGRLDDAGIGPLAHLTLDWTRSVLGDEARDYLERLPLTATPEPLVVMAHGALEDPRRYVRTPQDAAEQLGRLPARHPGARLLLLGHTHVAAVHAQDGAPVRMPWLGPLALPRTGALLLNPGSVGQPRGVLPYGRVAVLDTDASTVERHVLHHDRSAARAALAAAGLPPHALHVNPLAPAALLARGRRRLRRLRHLRT
jgi:predicted phosphodiesterase